jgi:hypothetical protein
MEGGPALRSRPPFQLRRAGLSRIGTGGGPGRRRSFCGDDAALLNLFFTAAA